MKKMVRPLLEVVRFGAEDVIATSGLAPLVVSTLPVYSISDGTWYLIMNGEGAQGFTDWNNYATHYNYGSDVLTLVQFSGGDWFNDPAPGGTSVADSSLSEHTSLQYIWYNSGSGVGNVTFNTHGQTWSYYLDNGISLPISGS